MSSLKNDSGLFTQSEFRSRGIIKLAPDVLVYVGGHLSTSIIAPVSSTNQNVSFNDGITTVSIQNNVDPPGSSSANIEITAPIYNENSKYWTTFSTEGKSYRVPIFGPMMEVKIYFKGRFLVDMQPKYYPAFWGLITNVEENYSGGAYKITLQCVDMLHWWSYVQINTHPVPESNIAMGGGQTLTPYQTIFKNANPFTIMWRLANDMYVPRSKDAKANQELLDKVSHMFVVPSWLAEKYPLKQIYPPGVLKQNALGIMTYWQQRFENLGTLLKMYGAKGDRLIVKSASGDIAIMQPMPVKKAPLPANSNKKKASFYADVREFDVTESLRRFTVFFEFDKMSDFSDAEYMSKLEIATEVKNRVEYEFFQDVDGTFMFKPPFFNLNTKYVEPYVIRPNDVINCSFQTETEGIVTVLQVKTPFHGQLRGPENPSGVGFHMDIELTKRYGLRFKEMPLQYIKADARVAAQLAVGHLSLINSKCFTGSVTIPGRPEMRLGYPIYLSHRDSFHYVKSINHSFDYGGSFSTTLSLEAERKRAYDYNAQPPSLMTRKIYRFKEGLEPGKVNLTEKDLKAMSLTKEEANSLSLLQDMNRLASIYQGRYEVVDQSPGTAGEIESSVTDKTVPLTDEEGYRVIGGFRYGRGIIATGQTRMDSVDMAIASGSSGVERLQLAKNDMMTMMVPASSVQESQLMSMFFSKISANEDGIVPSYVNVDDTMSIDVAVAQDNKAGSAENKDSVTNTVPSGFANEKSKNLVNQGQS